MNQRMGAIIVSVISDFIISGGGCLLAGMTAAAQVIPSTATLIFAGVTGLVQAARGVQKLLAAPPSP
jgi:pyrroline-5-carboxylate reductase